MCVCVHVFILYVCVCTCYMCVYMLYVCVHVICVCACYICVYMLYVCVHVCVLCVCACMCLHDMGPTWLIKQGLHTALHGSCIHMYMPAMPSLGTTSFAFLCGGEKDLDLVNYNNYRTLHKCVYIAIVYITIKWENVIRLHYIVCVQDFAFAMVWN